MINKTNRPATTFMLFAIMILSIVAISCNNNKTSETTADTSSTNTMEAAPHGDTTMMDTTTANDRPVVQPTSPAN